MNRIRARYPYGQGAGAWPRVPGQTPGGSRIPERGTGCTHAMLRSTPAGPAQLRRLRAPAAGRRRLRKRVSQVRLLAPHGAATASHSRAS